MPWVARLVHYECPSCDARLGIGMEVPPEQRRCKRCGTTMQLASCTHPDVRPNMLRGGGRFRVCASCGVYVAWHQSHTGG